VDIRAIQNLPQSRTKLVGFMLSPAWCNNGMGLGGEYSDRSQQLACLRQSIHTHKKVTHCIPKDTMQSYEVLQCPVLVTLKQ